MNKIRISLHFSLCEFACPCCGHVMLDEKLLEKLEALRVLYCKPLVITSGFRCERHNREVGGAINSLHLRGRAADIKVQAQEQERFLKLCKLLHLHAIPHPERGYVHVDLRG